VWSRNKIYEEPEPEPTNFVGRAGAGEKKTFGDGAITRFKTKDLSIKIGNPSDRNKQQKVYGTDENH